MKWFMVINVLGTDEIIYEDSIEYKEMGTEKSLEELQPFMAGHKRMILVAPNASQPLMLWIHQGLRDRIRLELREGYPVTGLDARLGMCKDNTGDPIGPGSSVYQDVLGHLVFCTFFFLPLCYHFCSMRGDSKSRFLSLFPNTDIKCFLATLTH